MFPIQHTYSRLHTIPIPNFRTSQCHPFNPLFDDHISRPLHHTSPSRLQLIRMPSLVVVLQTPIQCSHILDHSTRPKRSHTLALLYVTLLSTALSIHLTSTEFHELSPSPHPIFTAKSSPHLSPAYDSSPPPHHTLNNLRKGMDKTYQFKGSILFPGILLP